MTKINLATLLLTCSLASFGQDAPTPTPTPTPTVQTPPARPTMTAVQKAEYAKLKLLQSQVQVRIDDFEKQVIEADGAYGYFIGQPGILADYDFIQIQHASQSVPLNTMPPKATRPQPPISKPIPLTGPPPAKP